MNALKENFVLFEMDSNPPVKKREQEDSIKHANSTPVYSFKFIFQLMI